MIQVVSVSSLDDGNHAKCPRCWHWHPDLLNFGHTWEEVNTNPKLRKEKLCNRCQDIILTEFPDHPSVPHIKLSIQLKAELY